MAIIRAALQALQRNYAPLLFYIGVGFAVYSARLALDVVDDQLMPTLHGIERDGGAHRAEADETDFHAAHG